MPLDSQISNTVAEWREESWHDDCVQKALNPVLCFLNVVP